MSRFGQEKPLTDRSRPRSNTFVPENLNAFPLDAWDITDNDSNLTLSLKDPWELSTSSLSTGITGEELPLGTILMWHKSLEARGGTATSTGTATTDTADKLVDTAATFSTDGVVAGSIVYNSTDSTYATVQSVDSETQLTLDWDAFPDGNEAYSVYPEPDVQPGWVEMDGSTISDADSPFNGMTIEDVVGSERFFRARETAGRLQQDAMQRVTGGITIIDSSFTTEGALSLKTISSTGNRRIPADVSAANKYLWFDNADSTSPNPAKTDDAETRPTNISIVPIVKIKESADVKLATYYSVAGDNFNTLTELTSLHADDVLVIYDDSASVYKKVKLSTLKTWINT